MNEWALAAVDEMIARIDKLSRFAPDDGSRFDLPTRSDDRDIVERNLEIISEASRRLPQELKAKRAEVDWRVLADLGNVLRHAYHSVEEARLVEMVVDRLGPLRSTVVAIRADLEAE